MCHIIAFYTIFVAGGVACHTLRSACVSLSPRKHLGSGQVATIASELPQRQLMAPGADPAEYQM